MCKKIIIILSVILFFSILLNIVLGTVCTGQRGRIAILVNEVQGLYLELGKSVKQYITEYREHRADITKLEQRIYNQSVEYARGIQAERRKLELERIRIIETNRRYATESRAIYEGFKRLLQKENID